MGNGGSAVAIIIALMGFAIVIAPHYGIEIPFLPETQSERALRDIQVDVSDLSDNVVQLTTLVERQSQDIDQLTFLVESQIVEIDQLTSLVERQTFEIEQLTFLVDNQAVEIDQLKSLVNQQIDEINRLRIPGIVENQLQISDIVVDQIAGPLIEEIKSRVPGILHPVVDLATNAIKSVIQAKLGDPSVALLSASQIASDLYSINAIVSIPIRISEIPALAVIQNIIGDVTFMVEMSITANVNVSSQTVSGIQYRTVNVRV